MGDVTLIDLLEEIAKIPEVKRIRLGSLEPGFITKDTLDRLSKMESFCPHFHLSLQSGCDSVLKRMNRKYTTQDIREKCKAIREHFQYPALTTDIIVGFPGETEEEFEETRKFLEEIDLYEMHVFKYSIRKGTKAADMKPQINDQIKAKRSNILLEMSKLHQKEFETKQLGMVKEVLIEEKMHGKDHYYTGHTKEYIKVALYSEEPLENKIVKFYDFHCYFIHFILKWLINERDVIIMDNNQTQHFSVVREELDVHMILERVYEALQEKGYNPVNQMVGYIMSGDPTYITSHNNARSIINKVERDDIIEALLENYIETRLK